MYNAARLIKHCLEKLKTLYVIDENRNRKEVENFEDRRRQIWRAMACPTIYHWRQRPATVPIRKVRSTPND